MSSQANVDSFRAILVDRIERQRAEVTRLENLLSEFNREFSSGPTVTTISPRADVTPPKPATASVFPAVTLDLTGSLPTTIRKNIPEVADGKLPKLRVRVVTVMENEVLNATAIYERLNARKWLPNASDARSYIAQFLSTNKDTFEKVPSKGRGYYRVISKTVSTINNDDDTDAVLEEIGIISPN